MPKPLGIPQPLQRPLKSLFEVPIDKRASILTTLSSAAVKSSPEDLVVALSATGVSKSDAQRLVTAIVSLYGARDDLGIPIDKFVDRVILAAQEFPDLTRPKISDWANVGPFIREILSLHGTIGLAAKSVMLRSFHERIFRTSQIVTDLRPIYATNPDAPIGAVITHNLRVALKEGDDIFISLDSDDLRHLRNAIDRAFKKEESLRSLFARDGFTILATEETES